MGEAINLVENFKVEKVIFNCGEFNDLEQELIKVLDQKYIKYYKDDKKTEDIEFLMKHYQCSREVAESYLELLDEEKLKILKDSYGGR